MDTKHIRLLWPLLAAAFAPSSCSGESPDPEADARNATNDILELERTAPPAVEQGETVSTDSLPSPIDSWAYGEPVWAVSNDGVVNVDPCTLSSQVHTIVVAEVSESTVHSHCPLLYTDVWQEFSITVKDVIAGYDIPAGVTVHGFSVGHGSTQAGELRVVTLRRTVEGWFALSSIPIHDRAEQPSRISHETVRLPEAKIDLRTAMNARFANYHDFETCPHIGRWQSDQEFMAAITRPAEHCESSGIPDEGPPPRSDDDSDTSDPPPGQRGE